MEKEMLALVNFKEGKMETFMGWMPVSYTHLTLPTI